MLENQMKKVLQLLLYRTMPAVDAAWLAGYETAGVDGREHENPFAEHDDEHNAWKEGWWFGLFQDGPLYQALYSNNFDM